MWFDFVPIYQAEKTAPTNPMKDLHIEKLVISAFSIAADLPRKQHVLTTST